MDHTAILALIVGILGALSLFAVKVWGDPQARMTHAKSLKKLESDHAQAIEKIEVEAENRRSEATERLISSWEKRATDLEKRMDKQSAEQARLAAANTQLKKRVSALEEQLRQAGSTHRTDLATIEKLQTELTNARDELAAARKEIAELLERVRDLDALLHRRTDSPVKKLKQPKTPHLKVVDHEARGE